MLDPANPISGINPMAQFQTPMDPLKQQAFMQLMMLLGGLAPQVPQQPQPQASRQGPLLGGPVG